MTWLPVDDDLHEGLAVGTGHADLEDFAREHVHEHHLARACSGKVSTMQDHADERREPVPPSPIEEPRKRHPEGRDAAQSARWTCRRCQFMPSSLISSS